MCQKIQKAFMLWQERGFQAVVARVLRHFRNRGERGAERRIPDAFLAPLPHEHAAMLSPKVLIIAELSIPQCRIYRVEQKVKMLESAGWCVKVVSWTDILRCRNEMQTASLVIVYRSPFTQEVQSLYSEARRLGVKVGFDIDDLVFDVDEYSRNSNVLSLPASERAGLLAGAALYRDALAAADFSISSTSTLAKYMSRYCSGPCYVVPNALDDIGSRVPFRYPLGTSGEVVIGYGSGTSTHDRDFDACTTALLRILDEFPQTILALHGTLTLPETFDKFLPRVRHVPFVPFSEYSNVIARFDVNLAPLESTVFNDCKSNIKFLEAARNSVPTVASPCAEFAAAIKTGENGFLARNDEEWYVALRRLVESQVLRHEMGMAAKRTAEERYSISSVARGDFMQMLQEQAASPLERDRRRILVVNVLYAPMSFGGATVQAENLVSQFSKKNDVAVFTSTMDVRHGPGHITRYENKSVPCFVCETAVPPDPMRNYESQETAEAFQSVLRAFLPDVVHFNSIQFMGVDMLRICREKGIPYIVTVHDAWWICPRQFMKCFCGEDEKGIDLYRCVSCVKSNDLFMRFKLLQGYLLGAEAVLAPSDYQRELYVKSGIPESLVRTNRNGIMVPAEIAPHQRQDVLTFAYLGGRCDHKGYFMLLRAMKNLHGDYKLKLVDINLRFNKSSISSFEWPSPSRVEVCEPFNPDAIDEFYRGIDVLLFPSCWKESFGLTVREALARNVWVVATDAGGDIACDLKNGENGDLVPLGDEIGFTAALQRLIDDPSKLVGYENPYRSAIATVQHQADEILAIVEETVTKSGCRPRTGAVAVSSGQTDLVNECCELRQKLSFVMGRFDEMSTSTCWRMTKPLRLVLDFVKRRLRRLRGVLL